MALLEKPSFLILLVLAGIPFLFGWAGHVIGKPKGKAWLGFFLGLFLGILGLLIIALISPDPSVAAQPAAQLPPEPRPQPATPPVVSVPAVAAQPAVQVPSTQAPSTQAPEELVAIPVQVEPVPVEPVAPTALSSAIPAAWYPNPEGPGQRYWDGTAWTEHYAP